MLSFQSTPPEYLPQSITVPIAMYSGSKDWLAVPSDVSRLETELSHVIKHRIIEDYEHLDFTWATNAPSACYDDVIGLIKQYYNIL